VFQFAAVLTPLILLAVIELGLRLSGYGYPTRFFLPAQIEGRAVWVENDKFGWRFFPPAIARSPTPTVVFATKAPGTFRIFLFGESAALGDPRPAYGVGRYLEVLLGERFPDARFEVVCAAMTAINSHGVLPIARECAALEGDLWIVYLGNNEFVGPFGLCNPFGLRAPGLRTARTLLALKATKLGQLTKALLGRLRPGGPDPHAWLGMKTMAEYPVRPEDPARETVYRNFAGNLGAIVEAGLRARAQVLLCSVASNLRDCPPFASIQPDNLPLESAASWSNLWLRALVAQANTNHTEATTLLEQALPLAPTSAELHFRLAQSALHTTRPHLASTHYRLARDHDALPFRADARLNSTIASITTRYAHRGVGYFDTEAALSADTPGVSPGQESFHEHVHFNFAGSYRLALALAAHVEPQLPATVRAGRREEAWASPELCARRLGLTDWNRFAVYESVWQRLQDAPFTNQIDHVIRLVPLLSRLIELRQGMNRQSRKAARALYEEALARTPADFRLHEGFAEFLEATGEFAEARDQWDHVRALIPHHCLPYYHLGRLDARLGSLPAAQTYLDQALARRPDFLEARLELGRVFARQGLTDRAIAEYQAVIRHPLGNPTAYLRLADLLAAQNRRPEATAALREAVSRHPQAWEPHYYLGVELAVEDQLEPAAEQFAATVRLRPDFALGHLNYAIALAKLGHLEPARTHFRETLRLDPTNARAAEYLRSLDPKADAKVRLDDPPSAE
jgi:tetratricopeptide (TPR) repeat protein